MPISTGRTTGEDVPVVLAHYWQQLGRTYDPADPRDAQSANAITTITGENFRLIEPLMTQIARVMAINQLETIAPEVVQAARQMLVVGTQ